MNSDQEGSSMNTSTLVRHVLELARRVGADDIAHWARLEIGGYYKQNPYVIDNDTVPAYRKIRIYYRTTYNRPLIVSNPHFDFINNYELRFNVAELEKLSDSEQDFFVVDDPPHTEFARAYLRSDVAALVFDKISIKPVLDSIRMLADDYVHQLSQHTSNFEPSDVMRIMHPKVLEKAQGLMESGHYRQAVLDVYIALIEEVKTRSGVHADGKPLMQTVFSVKNPVLQLSDDPDEQEGFMHLFEGAVQAIRHPKAHSTRFQATQDEAVQWLAFASALFRRLEAATRQHEEPPPS